MAIHSDPDEYEAAWTRAIEFWGASLFGELIILAPGLVISTTFLIRLLKNFNSGYCRVLRMLCIVFAISYGLKAVYIIGWISVRFTKSLKDPFVNSVI